MLQAVAAILYLGLVSACANSIDQPTFRPPTNAKTIFVVNYGWHSAIVIRRADIAGSILPEIKDFTLADYLEFGWGDWDYYQAPDPGMGLALKAAFWSSRSVLHVAGFKGPAQDYFRGSEIFEIALSDEELQRLIHFVSNTFLRGNAANPVESRPGLQPDSRFYPAVGKFHLLRTCNTWVAEALAVGGVPIKADYVITAGNLFSQLRRTGGVLRAP